MIFVNHILPHFISPVQVFHDMELSNLKLLQEVALVVLQNHLNKAVKAVYSRQLITSPLHIVNMNNTTASSSSSGGGDSSSSTGGGGGLYEYVIEDNECYEEEFESYEEYNEMLGK
jgi:uncharacterized membrane protein YgcG